MVRFILVCMAVVLTTMIATGAQFIMGGIGDARTDVMARNMPTDEPATVQPSGPSFEEIYANAPAAPSMDNMSPEQLNAMETAAGGNDDFSGTAFTNTAPTGLEDMPQPVMTDTIVVRIRAPTSAASYTLRVDTSYGVATKPVILGGQLGAASGVPTS